MKWCFKIYLCLVFYLQLHYQSINGSSNWSQTPENFIGNGCTEYGKVSNIGDELEFYIKQPTTNKCWFIKFQEEKWITIKFSYLNISSSTPTFSSGYTCDNYVQVENVPNDLYIKPDQQQTKFCGQTLPKAITMYSKYVVIRIHTEDYPNSSFNHVGFILSYNIACDHCENEIEVQSYQFISTCNYPHQYPLKTCTWNVTLESNLPLQITFIDFDIDDDTHITLYDGASTEAPLLESNDQSYYGQEWWNPVSLKPFTTTTRHLYIVLQTGTQSTNIYRGFNATVKAKGYCLPGTYSCGDQSTCYKEHERCDGERNCENGYDEMGCGGCPANEIWCGTNQKDCYFSSEYCDGKKDCQTTNSDEAHCSSCSKGAFFCKLDHRCIYERWRCDGQIDCVDESDEKDCTYTASRRVITAAIVGSLICGLLLSVALGCTCKLYTLRSTSHARHRNRLLMPTPLGRIARELMEREAPPSYRMCIDGVEVDITESSRSHSSSSSSRRRSRRHRRRNRNREPHIRRAQPLPQGSETGSEVSSNTASRQNSSSSHNIASRNNNDTRSTSNSIETPNTGVFNILSHLGLSTSTANRPLPPIPTQNETSRSEPGSSRQDAIEPVPSTSTESPTNHPEPQAKPLPKKRKIRPVLIEAPCNEISVEDIPGCLYPNPPSYSETIQIANPEDPTSNHQDEAESSDSSAPGSFSRFLLRHSPIKRKKDWKLPFVKIFAAVRSNSSPMRHEPLEDDDTEELDQERVDDFVELGSQPITRQQVEDTLKLGRCRGNSVANNDSPLVSVSQFYNDQNLHSNSSQESVKYDENSLAVKTCRSSHSDDFKSDVLNNFSYIDGSNLELIPTTSGINNQGSVERSPDTLHLQLSQLQNEPTDEGSTFNVFSPLESEQC